MNKSLFSHIMKNKNTKIYNFPTEEKIARTYNSVYESSARK
jgi:hypothetical protein